MDRRKIELTLNPVDGIGGCVGLKGIDGLRFRRWRWWLVPAVCGPVTQLPPGGNPLDYSNSRGWKGAWHLFEVPGTWWLTILYLG